MGAILSKTPCGGLAKIVPTIPSQDQIEKRIKEMLSTFGIEYLKAYKTTLINKLRREARKEKAQGNKTDGEEDESDKEEEIEFRSLDFKESDLVENPQLEGALLHSKSVDTHVYTVQKYWVLDNTFMVKQYAAKPVDEKAKPEKQFNFRGYQIKTLTLQPEENPDGSIKVALEFTHKRPSRPQFRLAFTDEANGLAWQGFLESACTKAPSPLNPDPALAAAFAPAVAATRSHCGLHDPFDVDGSEGEVLSDCLFEVLEREILSTAFAALGEGGRAKFAKTAVKKMLDIAIKAAVAVAFKAMVPIKAGVEAVAKKGLKPIFIVEKKIKDKISGPVGAIVEKVLGSQNVRLDQHLEQKYEFIVQAALEEVDVIHTSVQAILEKNSSSVDEVLVAITEERKVNQSTWVGRNQPISHKLQENLYVPHKSDSDANLYKELSTTLIQDYQQLNQFALLEIAAQLKKPEYASTPDPNSAIKSIFPDILKKVSHDLLLVTNEALRKAVDDKLGPKVKEHITPKLKELTDPAMSLIPEPLVVILNPEGAANDIVQDIVGIAEKNALKNAIDDFRTQLGAKIISVTI